MECTDPIGLQIWLTAWSPTLMPSDTIYANINHVNLGKTIPWSQRLFWSSFSMESVT